MLRHPLLDNFYQPPPPPIFNQETNFVRRQSFDRSVFDSRPNFAPSKIIPSKSASKLLNYLAQSESKKEASHKMTSHKMTSHKPASYKPVTHKATEAPPSPVLWMPGGDADCGDSDRGWQCCSAAVTYAQ